jgi:hypothetical protein
MTSKFVGNTVWSLKTLSDDSQVSRGQTLEGAKGV